MNEFPVTVSPWHKRWATPVSMSSVILTRRGNAPVSMAVVLLDEVDRALAS
ncbi:MAG: hypothetical protein JO333_10455 [Verrucomicrobia bacterium]|nr:hypothetical protein [Verrucomicrobiota bacterium]